MKVQTTIEKPLIPDDFLSNNADGDYRTNGCFCA